MKRLCCGTIASLLVLALPAVAQTPVIDGTAEGLYGPQVAVQDTSTGFGDSNLGLPDFANGSELDGAWAFINNCTLYIVLAGNLESNFNKLEIFFDTKPGGDNRLLSGYPMGGLNRMGETDPNLPNGLTFDPGFEADYWISVTGGPPQPGPYALYVNYSEVKVGGVGYYVGQGTALGTGTLSGGTNPYGILCSINNSNTAGVVGGTGIDFGGAGVATGVELALPLGALGVPVADVNICAFVNGVNDDWVSNQVLGGLGGSANLGEPRNVNFGNILGSQFFMVTNPGGCGACCVGTVCSITTQPLCAGQGGNFIGAGVPCLSGTCTGIATGACCVSGTCVPDKTQADCLALSGEYLGDDTICTTTICNTGACCTGTTCTIVREATCTGGGGTYFGDGSTCSPDPCTSGACCFGPSCAQTSPAVCANQNGTYKGDGTTCVTNPCNAPAGTPLLDGLRDASYGTARSIQDTQTGFGDNNLGQVDIANGSELDAAYSKTVRDRLFLFLAGNMESNSNKLELFFDTRAGGQNRLRGDNPDIDFNGLNRMGEDPLDPNFVGLTFDAAFDADFFVGMTNNMDAAPTVAVYVNYAELRIDPNNPGVGYYLGQGRAANYTNGGMLQYGGNNVFGALCTLDNSNIAGVIGGFALAQPPENPGDVATGVEFSIPLSALGNATGTIKVSAFINGSGHDYLSNQVLGPIAATGGVNLGDPRLVSFADALRLIPGNQYFLVSAHRRGDTNCDGVVSFADINPFVTALGSEQAWKNALGGSPLCDYTQVNDINCDGVVNFADINPFVQCLGSGCPNCP